jgi:hypothetical protein
MILYYPLIILLMVLGRFLEKRLVSDLATLRRADVGLGCAFIVLVSGPLVISVIQSLTM